VLLEELYQRKIPMTPSGIKPATCSAVSQPTALPRAPCLYLYAT